MNNRTLGRYRNHERDHCYVYGTCIGENDTVFSRYAGNPDRYALFYHIDCAKEVQLI